MPPGGPHGIVERAGPPAPTPPESEMPDFTRSTTIDAAPDELFEFLSKVDNLPKYFRGVSEAHHTRGDEIHVVAPADEVGGEGDVHGDVHGDAWFSIDAEKRSLAWGAEGPHDYKGELQVEPEGDGTKVTVSLHTHHEDANQINGGIDETLENIRRIVAERPPLQS